MWILLLVVVAVVLLISPLVRCAVFHPVAVIVNGARDGWKYIRRKSWNNADYGQIKCYVADSSTSFGCGKTLSATNYIVSLFRQYNDKPVWCPERRRMVTQKIKVISNVDFLTIPYERLVSLSQFVQWTDAAHDYDLANDTLTVTYMLIDEASSQLNSRAFKNNFDPYFIARLLTSRHVHASIILTSQRPGMVDKLMRDCTHIYVGCKKVWRFQLQNVYDAYDVENAGSLAMVAPLQKTCWFVNDSAFDNYDTYASVQSLRKSCEAGDMLSEAEIVALQANQEMNMDNVKRPSRRWLRRQKNNRK